MSSPADVLRDCWRTIAGDTGPSGDAAELIVARHAEPHRRYHTAEHVRWVLHHVDTILAAELPPRGEDVDVDALHAAALFHDIVYDPRSSTNEADSAEIAASRLSSIGWSDARCRRVGELVFATATHTAVDFETAVLVDADLAVLGAPPPDYLIYVDAIRFEYSFLDSAIWNTGRARVLRSFLDRTSIYATATLATTREEPARVNLNAELTALVSAGSR